MSKKVAFKSLLNKHSGKGFLIYCPGKNITEWRDSVNAFVAHKGLLVIGSNKITDLIAPDYHMFTNNDKYEKYGNLVRDDSTLLIGSHMNEAHIRKHAPKEYVHVQYTDRDKKEPISYNRKKDIIQGYYRTSGNLAIMICHLMGAKSIYIAGMCGFTYQYDGDVHYYKPEIKRDVKTKKEWTNKYDKPVAKALKRLKAYGVDFKIVTPTIYKEHYDGSVISL